MIETTVQFLGVGGAFSLALGQSNMLVERNGKRLLIDCGTMVQHSLAELQMGERSIDAVYITHQHADHIGGLEWLCFSRYFHHLLHKTEKPDLYINSSLEILLWENSLRGGMGLLYDKDRHKEMSLKDYFRAIHSIQFSEESPCHRWEAIGILPVKVNHITTPDDELLCFGAMLVMDGRKVFISGDTQFNPEMKYFYELADIIFHDCETLNWEKGVKCLKSGVHAHYYDLCSLHEKYKSKMFLYHYGEGKLPDAKADGFLGFVERGLKYKV